MMNSLPVRPGTVKTSERSKREHLSPLTPHSPHSPQLTAHSVWLLASVILERASNLFNSLPTWKKKSVDGMLIESRLVHNNHLDLDVF
jgi:hypothetical protein